MFGSKNKILLGVLGAVLVIIAVVLHVQYFSEDKVTNNVVDVNLTENPSPTVVTLDPVSAAIPPYAGEPITEIGNDPFILQAPASYVEKHRQRLAELKESLTSKTPDPADAELWLEVGLLKKFFNNYNGARDAWEYAKIVNPRLSTSYYNLGGLYAAYLRDNVKAEENYLKAIEADPVVPYLYFGAIDFYKTFYTEKSDQIPRILASALSQLITNQDRLDFKLLLARYYGSIGDKEKAIAYYKEIISADPQNIVVQEELNKLIQAK